MLETSDLSMWASSGLLECPHSMAAGFPLSYQSKPEQGGRGDVCYDSLRNHTSFLQHPVGYSVWEETISSCEYRETFLEAATMATLLRMRFGL